MPNIDDKVVAMSFESSKFESGVNKSLSSIEKLKSALKFKDSGKGLQAFGAAANRLNLGRIAHGIQEISNKLNAFRLVAVAVFADVVRRGIRAGTQLVKAFTIDPMKAGFKEYTTNLNSVQTILANTQASGATLKDVNKALDELNDYSDKTIYNFGQMARNIGTFTAAGVDLKTATASIKGIANLAALSGSNAQQASTAMYQLSQAISSGSVKLMDWNSVVNAGMGGTVFQRALATTGEHMGALKKGTVELVGPMKNVKIAGESFRNSLSAPGKDGWLTSKVLTKTLKMFTGDMTDAELAADGWNKKQIKAIQAQAKAAMLAATNVKSLDQVLNVAKETAGSGWAKTWRIIFGDFTEAKKTFTNLSNTINGMIIDSARARNNMLGDWKALGGRKVLIEGIKEAFHNLSAVLKPIKDAFREFFPRTTGKQLFDLTVRFKEFTEMLKPSPETIRNLHRTFRGLFSVLDIGKEIVFGLFGVFKKLIGETSAGEGGFLSFTATIGDALVAFHDWLIEGGRLAAFFDKLANVLAAPIDLLKALGTALKEAFSGISLGGIGGGIGGLTEKLSPLQRIMEGIAKAWNLFLDGVSNSGQVLKPIIDAFVQGFQALGPAINNALSSMNFQAILAVVRTGLLAGLVLLFKKFLGGGSAIDQITKGFGEGIISNISGSFSALQGNLVAMQNNVKADTLKKIATAVALLAISVLAISMVDPKRLSSSLGAMTVMFGQLLASMAIMEKISTSSGFLKMPIITFSLLGLAIAIDTLAIAVLALSRLSWNELLKGLAGIAVSMGVLVAAVGPLSSGSPGMIRAAVAMMAMAVALRILASAVKAMGEMDLATLGKGLGSVAIGLRFITGAMNSMPIKGMAAAGLSIVLIAVGLRILGEAVQKFGEMSIATLAKGLLSVSVALQFIATAMHMMPKGMALQAAGLLLVAVALQGIVRAIGIMGGMSISELAKGIGAMAVTLALLGLALIVMEGSIGGAVALGVAAGGIILLATALKTMGGMSWMEIIKAMVALSAAFAIIGVAALLITPAIPGLLGFGVAVALIGIGLAATGAALFLVAAGLSALVVAAPTGFGVLLAAITEFQKGLIENIKLFVLGILKIVQELARTAPQFVDAIVKILNSLIDGLIQIVPKLVPLIATLITALIDILDQNQDRLIQAGYNFLISFLQGLRNNIAELTKVVVQIIAEFINGIAKNIRKIVDSGVKLITSFLKAIASGYSGIVKAALSIITKFIGAIASNIGKIATAGLSIITRLLKAIANNLGKVIKAGADVIVKFIVGIGNAGPRIVTAAVNTIIKLITALQKGANRMAEAGFKVMIAFLNGLADTIEENEDDLITAGARVGVAIVKGIVKGLWSVAGDIKDAIISIAKDKLPGWAKKALHIDSPSKIFYTIGQFVGLGLAKGIADGKQVKESAEAMANSVITTVEDIFEITSPSKVMIRLAKSVTKGFALGLKIGSKENIQAALVNMRTLMKNELANLQKDLATQQDKLKTLRKNKATTKVIDAVKDAIAADKANIKLLKDTFKDKGFNKALIKNQKELLKLAKSYDKISAALTAAKDSLKEAIQEQKDAVEEFFKQYRERPDIETEDAEGNAVDPVTRFIENLRKQVGDTATYGDALKTLEGLGLDPATLEKLIREGPTAANLAFATGLVAAGAPAIATINALAGQLDVISQSIADSAGVTLYQGGVDAANELVKGLTSSLDPKTPGVKQLMAAINTLVRRILRQLRRQLGIASPSKEFAKIGALSMEGLAEGFSDSSDVATDAVDTAGQDVLTAMQQTMRDISDAVTNELDVSPTITPVLDLTQVKSKAAELAALTGSATTASSLASSISKDQSAQAEMVAAAGGTSVKFEQNNYSPESLSDIEIYRQTKNQLSMLKSSLALT